VGQLVALGAEALTARLGLEGLALLAAASSTALRPMCCVQPPEQFNETFEFENAVETVEPLLFLLRRFVGQLSQRLTPRGLVAKELLLELRLESGQKLIICLRIPQPTRELEVLFRTLHTALENVRTDALIRAVTLSVQPAPEEQKQLGLFETILSDPQQFQETLARLTAVLGPDRVGTPTLENTHRPDAFRLVAPDFENAPVPERPKQFDQAVSIRRFRPALKAELLPCGLELTQLEREAATGGPPLTLRCAMVQGKVQVLIGPWRASGNWWEHTGWEREEWDVAISDGQVIRLVHQPEGWYVEGVID